MVERWGGLLFYSFRKCSIDVCKTPISTRTSQRQKDQRDRKLRLSESSISKNDERGQSYLRLYLSFQKNVEMEYLQLLQSDQPSVVSLPRTGQERELEV